MHARILTRLCEHLCTVLAKNGSESIRSYRECDCLHQTGKNIFVTQQMIWEGATADTALQLERQSWGWMVRTCGRMSARAACTWVPATGSGQH